MMLQYIITVNAGPLIEKRAIISIAKDADGKRRINLLDTVAKKYVDMGWLVLDGNAPPPSVLLSNPSAEYDFKGATIRNARPAVTRYAASHSLDSTDKGSVVTVDATSSVAITLPKDWAEGEGSVIRRVGTGDVTWSLQSGASVALPASRASHTKIAERHSEIQVRVISNANGMSAVWAIEGPTA